MKDLIAADPIDVAPVVHLVKLEWLKPHEEVVSVARVNALLEATLSWGAYIQPLLVDIKTGAILDGHHRHRVGQLLKLQQLPCILVDYMSDASISVEHWHGSAVGGILEKRQVIDMALSPHVFPPKTSRHSRNVPTTDRIDVPLALLRQPPPFTGAYSNRPLKQPRSNQGWAC
ncbi:hypothetical protein AC1031_008014 [Aphanomyces cochlioides]|nr:hypothetical protein AC1031_008014 [Aphanomyces cochlioides]